MALLLLVAFLCGSLYVAVQSSDQVLHVYVDGEWGTDGDRCLKSNSATEACQSLSYVADNLRQTDWVVIEILSENLTLTESADFIDYTHLAITNTTICCDNASDFGLAFVNVRNLTIHSVTIDGCGAKRDSTSVDPQTNETEPLSVAVYILNCTDVTIMNVTIQSSHGTGLSMYDTNGRVDITHCNFSNNTVEPSELGGGGVHVEFTICSPGRAGDCPSHDGHNCNSKYTFRSCTFSNNVAYCPFQRRSFIKPSEGTAVPRLGKGGGLYISIGSDAMNNHFSIVDSTFKNNSARYAAGAMLIEYLNSAHSNTVSVNETDFINNTCLETQAHVSGGGGLVLGLMFYAQQHRQQANNNLFQCNYCTFERNVAFSGGGVGIYATKDVNYNSTLSRITFSHCNWTNNSSPMGAAVFITPGIWDYTTDGFLPVPKFSNCRFVSNSAIQTLNSYGKGVNVMSRGYGALFSSELKIILEGNSYFHENKGSAVHISNSVMEILEGSNVTFYRNTAHNGGAIAMYGSSVIHVSDNSTFHFIENVAYSLGGAIYTGFNAVLQPVYRNCFIQSTFPQFVDANFTFEHNKATVSGDSIFATTFQSCAMACNDINVSSPKDILECIANFDFSNTTEALATYPRNFTLSAEKPAQIHVIPGEEYHISLTVADEANNNLSGIVYEASVDPMDSNCTITVDPAFSQVSHNTIRLVGNVSDRANLHLHTSDVMLSFGVTLDECQPGYLYDNGSQSCKCAASKYLGLAPTCDPNAYLKHGYWMGVCHENSPKLCTGYCPYGFCSYRGMSPNAATHPLPTKYNLTVLDSHICGPDRTGRACGKCVDGRSVYFHSWKYECGPEKLCHLGWFFYLISEILPLTLLYVVILVFNISFTNGNVNCFIFFAQLIDSLNIDANGSLEYPFYIQVIHGTLAFFHRPFNLNFFTFEQLSFCLWKGATVMDILLMKYTTVAFALVLVLMTMVLVSRCRYARFKLLAKFNTPNSVLIHGLSAFFVLCYSQSIRVTFHILNYFCLFSANFKCEVKVVNLVGYMTYLEGEHVKYVCVAVFVLIFMIIIPPLLLLFYPLMFKLLGYCNLSESKLTSVLWRVMPIQLLDAFQSSFKDEFRFFAGLYFLYRALIIVAFASTNRVLKFYSVVQIQLLLFLAIHAIFQPYKERKHNIIDALLFTNLAIINSITLYNFSDKEFTGLPSSEAAIIVMALIQSVFISLPFLCVAIIGIMIWRKRRRNDKSDSDDDELPPLRSCESTPLIHNFS